MGPTGSGKSTIIRLLCRLYEPQQGRILLGTDIRTIPMADLRRELGVVLQDTFLFSGNVADNLRLNASVSDRELAQVCAELVSTSCWPASQRPGDELRERAAISSASANCWRWPGWRSANQRCW